MTTTPPVMADEDKIVCQIDNARVHSIKHHLDKMYPGEWTIEKYREKWPDAPIYSPFALRRMAEKKAEIAEKAEREKIAEGNSERRALADVFGFGSAPAAQTAYGKPIMVRTFNNADKPDLAAFVPDIDSNYVFDIELVKTVLMGIETGMPVYAWGLHGTGKTTLFEQVAARTGRPFLRVQHTINTEESHIVGQYIVRDGATHFQPGPLTQAMMMGIEYCADEYDFAMPSVLSVYQPVLEGKPLVIKDAPLEYRVVRPHPNFRFVATGNTNGGGDETGLYQGTQIQNAANYSRFGIVLEVPYMEPKLEAAIVAGQSAINLDDAKAIVSYAQNIREAFKAGKVSSTISTRELINSAKIGAMKGNKWVAGLTYGFMNRLSRIDKEVASQFAQRVFG